MATAGQAKKLSKDGPIPWIVIGVGVYNSAIFPIQCKVIKLVVEVQGKFSPKKDYEIDESTIPQNGNMCFYEHMIELKKPFVNELVEGYVTFELKYGRPNKMYYSLKGKKKISLIFNNNGDIVECHTEDQTMNLDLNSKTNS